MLEIPIRLKFRFLETQNNMLNDNYIISLELLKEKITSPKKYPFNLPVVQHLNSIELKDKVTFFIGENGSGKSTLLEALAVGYGFNAEGGSKNFRFSTFETHSSLSEAIRIIKGVAHPKDGFFFRAESFYNVATNIEELKMDNSYKAYGGKSLHEQSHGESFFSIFLHRFFGNGLYILDEPEAALSPDRQLAFLIQLNELVKQKSQFIISTHSPIILAYPKAKIIQISENGFEEINYKETAHYQTYKNFLNNPELMLRRLGL